MSAENEFKLRGIRWSEETFSTALNQVLDLHRAISGRRVAYHFGISEKAIRDLKKRSPLAARVIADLKTEAISRGDSPARYRECKYWGDIPPGEMGVIFKEAREERSRQSEIRRNQKRNEAAQARKARYAERTRRHHSIQSCKSEGMTQATTAIHLALSLSTVKRYWAETLPKKPNKKRGRPPLAADEKLIRKFMRQYPGSRTPALHAAQLMEAEGFTVPATLKARALEELEKAYPVQDSLKSGFPLP